MLFKLYSEFKKMYYNTLSFKNEMGSCKIALYLVYFENSTTNRDQQYHQLYTYVYAQLVLNNVIHVNFQSLFSKKKLNAMRELFSST